MVLPTLIKTAVAIGDLGDFIAMWHTLEMAIQTIVK